MSSRQRRGNVADDDLGAPVNERPRELVERVPALVLHLGVERGHALRLPGALRPADRFLRIAPPPTRTEPLPVRAGWQRPSGRGRCRPHRQRVRLPVQLRRHPPKLSVSKLVNALKDVSSRRLRTERPDMHRHWGSDTALWSPTYFAASCGGAPITVLRRYIEAQNRRLPPRPDRRGFRRGSGWRGSSRPRSFVWPGMWLSSFDAAELRPAETLPTRFAYTLRAAADRTGGWRGEPARRLRSADAQPAGRPPDPLSLHHRLDRSRVAARCLCGDAGGSSRGFSGAAFAPTSRVARVPGRSWALSRSTADAVRPFRTRRANGATCSAA